MGNRLLIADTGASISKAAKLPPGYVIRPAMAADVDGLGRLYFEATEPGVVDSLSEAVADIGRAFDGGYGEHLPEASLLVEHSGAPVAALLAVRRAPWAGTPDCPWINDLFTARYHRRRGLARALVITCMHVVAETGAEQIALRVNDNNASARALYEHLGFTQPTTT